MRILIVEPREAVANALISGLSRLKAGCETIEPRDLIELFERDDADGSECAVVIGGVEDAVAQLSDVRQHNFEGAVVALLDQRSSETAIRLLGAGADDVMVKPVNAAELYARLQAVRRRSHGHSAGMLHLGQLTVYFDGRDPEVAGQRVKLSHREHAIFTHLALQAGKVVSKNSVYEAVYGMMDSQPFDKVIDVYICKLRKKLSRATGGEQYIETVYGRGYKLDKPERLMDGPEADGEEERSVA